MKEEREVEGENYAAIESFIITFIYKRKFKDSSCGCNVHNKRLWVTGVGEMKKFVAAIARDINRPGIDQLGFPNNWLIYHLNSNTCARAYWQFSALSIAAAFTINWAMPVLIERNMRGSVIKLVRKLDIHNYGHRNCVHWYIFDTLL